MAEKIDIEPGDSDSSLIMGEELDRYFELNEALREFSMLFQEEKNERAAAERNDLPHLKMAGFESPTAGWF